VRPANGEPDMEFVRKGEYVWELPPEGGMRVPGRIFASERLMEDIRDDVAARQVANVAHLPGIVGYSWAMPDVHMGYGFPIGGVAATAFDQDGVVSPGGVGYDINCGVRMMAVDVKRDEIVGRIANVVNHLFRRIPCGANPHESGMGHLNHYELKLALERGAGFAVDRGFGSLGDLENAEENGCLAGADPDVVSDRAVERGRRQLGSLGSGNHFVEVGYVEEVCSPVAASAFGLEQGDVTVLIHTGSRGLGHQVCTDFLRTIAKHAGKFPFHLPDRQLAAAPLESTIGRDYLAGMAAAANYAWANRQTLMAIAQKAIADAFGCPAEHLGFRLLYDVSHNIAKVETHQVGGSNKEVCVHRKGATRALPPGDRRIPECYRAVGQPVLIPGDMGTASYLCVGAAGEGDHPFHSSCHGAGRRLSRKAAVRKGQGRSITAELARQGVTVSARNKRTLAEEMPEAYKDVSEVVDVMVGTGLLTKVVKVKPIGVIKG
jgi:tRNA-splicing ligase RtcB